MRTELKISPVPRWLRIAGMCSWGLIFAVFLWELAGTAFDDHFERKRNEDICAVAAPDSTDEYAHCMENGLRYACRLNHFDDIYVLANCYNSHVHILHRFASRYWYSIELDRQKCQGERFCQ